MKTSKLRLREAACYLSEVSMVQDLTNVVTSEGPLQCRQIKYEFDYNSGRADLIGLGVENAIHAFETKLSRWRKALAQARRNLCFAHYCYVALPERSAAPAFEARSEFEKCGVGLVVLTGQGAKVLIEPRRNSPLLPWLTDVALAVLGRCHTKGLK